MIKDLAERAKGRELSRKTDVEYAKEILNMKNRCDRLEALQKVPNGQREAVRQHVITVYEHNRILREEINQPKEKSNVD